MNIDPKSETQKPECPKCRTLSPESCHSMHCPMRKNATPNPFVAPVWYTKEEIFHYLKRENYSEQIAGELSEKWSTQLQSAFEKGFEKAQSENQRLTEEIKELKEHLLTAHGCGFMKLEETVKNQNSENHEQS